MDWKAEFFVLIKSGQTGVRSKPGLNREAIEANFMLSRFN